MRGKSVSDEVARQAVAMWRENSQFKLTNDQLDSIGSGEEWDESRADRAAMLLKCKIEALKDNDRPVNVSGFDNYACHILHKELALPANLAAADGFWRWRAVAKFADVIEERHKSKHAPARFRNYGIDAGVDANRIAILWFRADILYDHNCLTDPYHLARKQLHTDFIESGIFRIRYGWCRNLARTLVRFQYRREDTQQTYLRRSTDPNVGIRVLWKRLRQLHSVISFEFLSEEEIWEILEEKSQDLR